MLFPDNECPHCNVDKGDSQSVARGPWWAVAVVAVSGGLASGGRFLGLNACAGGENNGTCSRVKIGMHTGSTNLSCMHQARG